MSFDLDVEGLEEQLGKLNGFDQIARRHLRAAMQKSLVTIGSEVVPLVPVGVSARLKNSMGSTISELGPTNLVGRYGSSMRDEIYPQVMEFGREPGTMPPPGSLLRWVHLKLRPPEEEEERVAFLVARAIKRRGIKGRHFMSTGLEKAMNRIKKYFLDALDRIAQELTNGS